MPPMKHWETVADRLSAAGWSWGYSPLPEMAGVGLLTHMVMANATSFILTNR